MVFKRPVVLTEFRVCYVGRCKQGFTIFSLFLLLFKYFYYLTAVDSLVTTVNSGKTANLAELPFEMVSEVDPSNRVLDGRASWRYLANTAK